LSEGPQLYLVALGSNMRHRRFGAPPAVIAAALRRLDEEGLEVIATAATIASPPLGPSRRRYANSVAIIAARLSPPELLALLQAVEGAFGRRRRGRRWGARVLDLDIVLWSGGRWRSPGLVVPHLEFRRRDFVLAPAARLARGWRDPVTGLAIAHLAARLTRPRPLPTAGDRSGP
jgi:2-amino-4-hydroxy-6-hydroxymethyldihydropteridine diphosphokinase